VSGDITVAGHAQWLPLLLEGDLEEGVRAQVVDLIGETADPERVDDVVDVVSGVTRLTRAAAEPGEGVLTLAAWMHLEVPGLLEPGQVALLRLHALDEGTTLDDVLHGLVGDPAARFGPVSVDDLDTASGRAAVVRHRPVDESVEPRAVHQSVAVVWHRPEDRVAFVLSTYSTDLVAAAPLGAALLELAAGVDLGGA
jgi:hypothetical protein